MVSKILSTLCIVLAALAVSQAQGPPAAVAAANPWIPKWTLCKTIGSSCLNCNTKQICTKIGGINKACSDPTLPYCNLGECSATPTLDCLPKPIPAVPANAGVV